jgi:hypothetical protein
VVLNETPHGKSLQESISGEENKDRTLRKENGYGDREKRRGTFEFLFSSRGTFGPLENASPHR